MATEPEPEPELVRDVPRRFVLITGAGRSGTSTAAGALNMLGLHVPPPFLDANASNPRGFFESKWPVQFHNALMRSAYVATVDGRPDSLQAVSAAITPEHRRDLRAWLREVTAPVPQTAVKDPRAAWTIGLWSETVSELGMDVGYLTMLRHPAEVLGSRASYYATGYESLGTRGFAIKNLAGWVNSILITERQSRSALRTFVRYDDMITDWRAAMSRVRGDLDLRFNADLDTTDPHPVDDFIDSSLQRHPLTWADVDVPERLQDLAEAVWCACGRIADNGGIDADAQAELDTLGEEYESLYADARAFTHDTTAAKSRQAGDEAGRTVKSEMAKKVSKARARARAAESSASARRWPTWSRAASALRRRVRSH